MLVDLNPFSALTDPLLFSWEELQGWVGPAELRLVGSGCVQPSSLHAYRLPQVCSTNMTEENEVGPGSHHE